MATQTATSLNVYYAEYEDQHETEEGLASGCIMYPMTLTTEHPASSHGLPVLVAENGAAYGPHDLPGGEVQLTLSQLEYASLLDKAGYRVTRTEKEGAPIPVDKWGYNPYEGEEGVDWQEIDHRMPGARLVFF